MRVHLLVLNLVPMRARWPALMPVR